MAGTNGTDVILLANIGTDVAPNYVVVGSQTDVKFDEKNATIDLSNKQSGRFKEWIPGRWEGTVTLDHLYVPQEQGFLALRNASRNGTMIRVMRQEFGNQIEWSEGLVSQISEQYKDQAAATVQVVVNISGGWTAA
jgi:hypothetical protein